MPKNLTVSISDIIHKLKLSYQIPNIVKDIASQTIIREAVQEFGIEITESELQAEGDKLRLEKKLATAKETWAWLDKHHLSVKDFEELIYNNLIKQKLANRLFSEQVDKFFYENRLNYDAAVTYEVIFENRDLALELFYALEEEEITFPEVARLYIQDRELRRTYGYQGIKYRHNFRPEIAAVVFASSPPEILKPVSTSKGIYLVWVEEIIKPELDEKLRQKIISELFEDWLKTKVDFLSISTQVDMNFVESQDEIINHV